MQDNYAGTFKRAKSKRYRQNCTSDSSHNKAGKYNIVGLPITNSMQHDCQGCRVNKEH